MRVGITLPTIYPFGSTEQLLKMYEQVGFDSYWAPDHLLGVFHPDLWPDIALSAMGPDPDAFYDPFCYRNALLLAFRPGVKARVGGPPGPSVP